MGADDPGPRASPRERGGCRAALELGSSFGAPTLREVEIAETVAAAVPSIDKVRFVSSGTEAAMSAVRVARGVTGRDKIVKMTGHYHGHVDALLVQAGSAATTLGTPNSPGVTAGAAGDTLLCPFNDASAVADLLEHHRGQVAAVLLEPIAGNMGLVPPRPGYLENLRELTEKHGTLLVFDEVMTGFRVAYGGAQSALRCHARPHGSRQDHRRRPARGGLRCSGGDHGPCLARRPDLPGGHALGQSAGHGRRASNLANRSATTRLTSGSKHSRPGWPRVSIGRPPTPGSPTSSSASAAC